MNLPDHNGYWIRYSILFACYFYRPAYAEKDIGHGHRLDAVHAVIDRIVEGGVA